MSLSDSLVLKDSALADKTFVTLTRDAQSVLRFDTASNNVEPRTLSVKHSVQGTRKTGITNRHLISATDLQVDSLGNEVPMVVNLTMSVPQNVEATDARVKDLIAFVTNAVADPTRFTQLMRGES